MSAHAKHHKQSVPAQEYDRLVKLSSLAAVGCTSILIVLKTFAWLETNSSAVLVSLLDSAIDALSSIINFIVLTYALAPADKEHRFGHGKAEAIAGLGQAAFIFGSAGVLILHAVEQLLNPKTVQHATLGIGIITFSIVVTLLLVAFQKQVIRRTGSLAIEGDSLHYSSDLLINFAVIAGLVLASTGYPLADPLVALGAALFIIYNAYRLAHKAIHSLLDRELDEEIRQTIGKIALAHAQVKGVHDLRTRDSGKTMFIQMHIELPDHLPLIQAHKACDAIEADILKTYPNADVIIHLDPISTVDEQQIQPFRQL